MPRSAFQQKATPVADARNINLSRKDRVREALAGMGFPYAEVSGPDDDPRVLLGDGLHAVPNWACSRAFEEANHD